MISRSTRRVWLAYALVAGLLPTLSSAAATHFVDVDGTYDAATEDCAGADAAFTTIQSAVTAAADTDTILVCPGTYAETKITINKAVVVQSVDGAATTIIDGGGGTGLALSGTVHLTATTGNVLFDGFTVQNAKAGPSSVRINVRAGVNAPGVVHTVTNNVLIGTNNPADGTDYGLYAAGPIATETFVFQYNELRNHGSNTILIERHVGPTDVSFNTFSRGVRSAGISAYFNMSHTNTPITGLQKVSHNTIDMANDVGPFDASTASTAIVFSSAFTGTNVGSFAAVEISNNTIKNLRGFRRGIVLTNGANTLANQAFGAITNAVISCNEMTGPVVPESGSQGIRLSGFVSNPTITNNDITGVDEGFRAEARNGHIADTATLEENSLANTGIAAIAWAPTGALAAETNWFGSATGPTEAGNPGGTGGVITATGPVDYVPWLGNGTDADADTCFIPGDLDACNGVETCTAPGVCDAPDAPDGTTCDDGNACSVGDVCTAGVCSGPGNTCGNGVIDGACGETCDDGAGNGTNLCCSATCGIVDTDTDTICDRDDPCTNGVPATKHKLILAKLLTPAADDRLNFKGSAVIPLTPTLNPSANGVRLLLIGDDGTSILDVTIPSGAYDPVTKTGWRSNGAQTAWNYKGPGTSTQGIQKVSVKLAPRSVTGGVKFKVKGKNGLYPVTAPNVPVDATLVLDPPSATTGQCIQAVFPATPPAKPSCALTAGGSTLKCR